VLIHLLDGLAEDPLADFSQINSELALFDPNLAKKPQIVALNKIDQPEVQERLKEIKASFKKKKVDLLTVSALARTGTHELLLKAAGNCGNALGWQEPPHYRPGRRQPIAMPARCASWRISGPAIERSAAMTFWEHDGSVRRFQKLMEKLGVDEALRKAGIQEGDTVHIGDFELEWQE
jgi:GTP-binding protein